MTIAKILHGSAERHTLVLFYDESLKYSRHELYDAANKPESTSGY